MSLIAPASVAGSLTYCWTGNTYDEDASYVYLQLLPLNGICYGMILMSLISQDVLWAISCPAHGCCFGFIRDRESPNDWNSCCL